MKILSSLLVLLFSVAAFQVQAQKLGHINSSDLLQKMPEVKVADSTLALYQKQLEDQNSKMISAYQSMLSAYQDSSKIWNEVIAEYRQNELSQMEQNIQDFQQSAQDKFANKKDELYSPILKKADDAIKAVAKANSYAYIFDTSDGAVLYSSDSDDIMSLVTKQLGIQ